MQGLLWETSLLDPEEGIRFRGYSIPELQVISQGQMVMHQLALEGGLVTDGPDPKQLYAGEVALRNPEW